MTQLAKTARHRNRTYARLSKRSATGRKRVQLDLLALEDRRLLSTYTVTSPLDTVSNGVPMTGTFRWAVYEANLSASPSTINFNLGTGAQKVTLSQLLDPVELSNTSEPITITGPGANLLTIDAHDEGAAIRIDQGVTATITGITVTNASLDVGKNGGAISNIGTLTISDCTLTDNTICGLYDAGTATISDLTVTGNNSFAGAGIFVTGTATISDCTLTGNTGASGAGIDNHGTTTVTDCTISGDSALGGGGGLYNAGQLKVYGSTISSVTGGGGGGLDNNSGTAYLSGCTISDGSGFMNGGGVQNESEGTLEMVDCTITSSSALSGGGLYNAGTATLDDCTLTSNTATSGSGGGITNGPLANKAVLIATGSTIAGNTASLNGGGVYNNGTAALTDTTIADNFANQGTSLLDSNGGGVNNTGTATLVACTITGNTTTAAGGGVYNGGLGPNAMTLDNTIVAGNTTTKTPAGASDIAVGSSPTTHYNVTGSNNLIGIGGDGNLASAGNLLDVSDPGLAPLGDYGGPTETVALLTGSPAIQAGSKALEVDAQGNALTTDQRGMPLDSPAPDVGAFQTQSTIVVNTTTDGGGSALGTVSLRQAVALANLETAATIINFANSAFATAQTIILSGGPLILSNTTANITVQGPSAGLTISGGGKVRVLQVDSGVTANLTGVTISNGSADTGGGLDNLGTTDLAGCTIDDSTAKNGGGIANLGQLVLTRSTITGNSATTGGGLYDKGTATIDASTISGNTATTGGGIAQEGGTATLEDTIVAGNLGLAGVASDVGGSGASGVTGTYDLVGPGGSGGLSGGTGVVLLSGTAGPGLSAPGSYGGPTPTLALLPGSPAIGIGTGIAGLNIDQRGEPVGSSVDIGAFQSQGFTLAVKGAASLNTADGTAFASPLAVTVTAKNPLEPVAGGVVSFAVSPNANGASATLSATTAAVGTGGVAEVYANANHITGSYTVTASTAGAAAPVDFNLSNLIPVSFSGLTGVSITYGTATTTLRGTLGSGTDVPVGGTIQVTAGPVSGSTTVESGGAFQVILYTSKLNASSTPYTVTYSYAGDGTYAPATGTSSLTVAQATPTLTVVDAGGAYNGSAYPATATIVGVSGTPGSSLELVDLTLAYYAGTYTTPSQVARLTPLSAAPTAQGSYTALASFAGSIDYTAASAVVDFTIDQAIPTVTITSAGGTYDGVPISATASVTGVGGSPSTSLDGVIPTLAYYQGTTTDPSQLSNLTPLAGAPTAAGSYTVVASFAGSTNYQAATSAPFPFTIAQAVPLLNVTDGGGTYNGSTPPATVTLAGVSSGGASSLEGVTPSLVYFGGTYTTLAQLAGVDPLAAPPTQAGPYTVVAEFAGSTDYTSARALANFAIAQATPTLAITAPTGAFNGSAMSASVTVAGVIAGVDTTPAASLDNVIPQLTYYSGTYSSPTQLKNVTPLSGAPTDAGDYTVLASFGGSPDYAEASAVQTFTIAQATPTVAVTDAGGTYNGAAFPATATVTGVVAGVDNSPSASLEGKSPSLAYYTGTYTDPSQLSGVTPLSAAPGLAGTYTVLATFSGTGDYGQAMSLTTFTIARATPSIAVTATGGTYNGSTYSATATVAGLDGTAGASLEGTGLILAYYPGSYSSAAQLDGVSALPAAPVHGGTYTAAASFAGSSDYAPATGLTTFTIARATPQLTWPAPGSIVYGTKLGSTQLDSSAGALSGMFAYSPPAGAILDAGANQTLSVTFTPSDSTDYAPAMASTTISVSRATPSLTVSAPGGGFTGGPIAATASLSGAGSAAGPAASLQNVAPTLTYYAGEGTSGIVLGSTPPTQPGTYTVVASFPGTADYIPTTAAPLTFTIGKGTPMVSVSASSGSSVFGQAVTLTANVSAGAGQGSGSVTFYDGSTPLGSAPLGAGGTAVLTVSSLAPGGHAITASFGGNADDLPASSPSTSLSVTRAATEIVLVPQPIFRKKRLISLGLRAEVQAIAPGAGTPTGTLTFEVERKVKHKVRMITLGTAALDGRGDATITAKAGKVLKKSITILYRGDGDFNSTSVTTPVLTPAALKGLARPALGKAHHGPRAFGPLIARASGR